MDDFSTMDYLSEVFSITVLLASKAWYSRESRSNPPFFQYIRRRNTDDAKMGFWIEEDCLKRDPRSFARLTHNQ